MATGSKICGEQKMLRIRLARRGKKRQPSYRVVVAERSAKRDGRFVEQIGYYNPMVDPIVYKVKEDRALHWLSVGAQPSDAVRRLLDKQGTFDRLARLHAGEEFGKLVAEFEGTPWPPVVEEVEEAVEEAVETVSEEASSVVESVEETVSDVAETVSEAADDVVEAVSDVAAGAAETVADAAESAADVIDGDVTEEDSADVAESTEEEVVTSDESAESEEA